ncbi:MAG: choline dehydrogenase [Rhodospirillaceae bacterium]|nr:choline dehydrogenase [Rhodospirillaceae bacterium]MBT5082932.1 choline dehydrogenase [Rhodospirillaceae bacterium]MBT5524376.1 choline dehydrogenase [Rhodospirillaceae bacterium]MBT5878828.1 choline dehydrogenase [Rhodospirillaceae bacterium]MBT6590211.1 choline dehydrogenase [Rhodospirillaceae bacterium]
MTLFDYIIVGGGSAGCVLAGRLTEDPNLRVCLLEAGPQDTSPFIKAPLGIGATVPGKYLNWAFQTTPQTGLNGRRGYQPRGKVLGGSSAINAMIYTRGHAWDYDHWAALGNPGWSFADVLPYFKASQNQERNRDLGGDDYHGIGGPLNVADLRSPNPLAQAFVDAGAEIQLPRNDDFNGPEQEGVGSYQVTQIGGERCSAARAYLDPARQRDNLSILTGAYATKIILEGKRAVGVTYEQNSRMGEVRAGRDVILSAGAFQSPQLLLLSGIGPGAELQRHGIAIAHELPGVGQNLQDHIDIVLPYLSPSPYAMGLTPGGIARLIKGIFEWRRTRTGIITSNSTETGGFVKSRADLAIPDLQLHFNAAIVDDHTRKRHYHRGYCAHVCVLRPKSRGTICLNNSDPKAPPRIDPNFLGEREDLDGLVAGYKLTRRILEAPALAPYRGRELLTTDVQTDDQIIEDIRNRADTIYHPVGTAKMGPDAMAVVDSQLRVHGMDGLRVIDASIMPTLIGGNTNAPTIMIAEKAAAALRAK